MLIVSQIGATIGWALLGFASSVAAALAIAPIAVVFVARIIEGISGGNISVTQAYVADLVEPPDRARAFGLISAMFAAGMVFGPFGGGLLFARFGFAAPFLAAAALQLVTLVLTITMLPESREKRSKMPNASASVRSSRRSATRGSGAFSGRSSRSRSRCTDGLPSSRSTSRASSASR